MLRWGDLRDEVLRAIDQYGRPALARASGVSTTVLGRMLNYADDQPVKPETWAKLQNGIASLDAGADLRPALGSAYDDEHQLSDNSRALLDGPRRGTRVGSAMA